MGINRIDTYGTQVVPRSSEQQNTRAVVEEKSVPSRDATVESDRVRLSRGYQEMAQVKKVMMDQEEIRTDRVNDLRDSVTHGRYVVEPGKVAERMLENVW